MKIGEYEQMMSWLTRPETPTPIEPRENFAEGTRLTNEIFEEYIKKNKGKSYAKMAKDLTSKGYVPFQGSDVLSEKAIEARARRLGLTGMATSQISDFKTILNEATDENRLAYKRGEIDADLLRKRVIGRRADQKRIGTSERIERSREYRERVKTDPSMEAQRESAKASRARFREKEYLEYGTPPQAKTPKQFLFRDLFSIAQKSEKGDRLKLVKKFAKKDFKKENFYNDVEVLDTKTGKKFNFKNIEKYINPKNTGYSFKDVIKPYEQKVFLNEKGLRNEINSKMIPGWNTGLRDNYFEVQHVEGRFKNPFNVHISPKASNAREGVVRARFDKNWEKAKTLSDKKEAFKEYTDNLPKAIASQPGMITRPREFGERVPFDEMLRETKQSGVKLPRGILKDAAKLNSVLLPGLEEIVKGIKNIPDDIAKKRYFTLGLKALGPLGTYLAVDDTYEALKEGKSVAEALEYGLIGTNIIGSTKDVFALSPEEREARSVVKQAEMADQISQDESLLDTDFETPAIESDLSIDEAEKKYKAGQEAVRLKRKAEEADIARARAVSVEGLKDLMLGKRFEPTEIPTQFMANGGIMRLGFNQGSSVDDAVRTVNPERDSFKKLSNVLGAYKRYRRGEKNPKISFSKFFELYSTENFATGGRVGFADGSDPKDPKMNRRTFMKVMGGLASIPLLGKFIKPAAKVAESAAPVIQKTVEAAPTHFWNLVAKIKTFGDDITQFGALAERQSVKKYKDLELTEDMATGQIEIQRVKVAEDMDYYGSPVTEEIYMSYSPGEQIFQETANGKTKIIKSKPNYQEGTTYFRNDGPETGSVLDESSGIADDIFEEAGVPVPEAIRKK